MLARILLVKGARQLAVSTRVVQNIAVTGNFHFCRLFSEQADSKSPDSEVSMDHVAPIPVEGVSIPEESAAETHVEHDSQAAAEKEAKEKQFIENLLSSVAVSTNDNDDKQQIFDDIRTLLLDPDIRQLYYNYVESLPNYYLLKTDPEVTDLVDEVFINRMKEERNGPSKPSPPDELLAALKEKKRTMTESNTIITDSDDSAPLSYPVPTWIVDDVESRNKIFTTFAGQKFSSSSLKANTFMNSLDAQRRFPHRPHDVEMAVNTFGIHPYLTPEQARSDKKAHDTHAYTLLEKHKMLTSKGTTIAFAAGKRKNAVAQVFVKKGSGAISINGKSLIDYFPAGNYRDQVLAPLAITLSFQQFDIKATVRGGGMTGQSESIRLALAKAISFYEPSYTMVLQKAGLLKTDTRIVERKKPGHRKARKMQQWVKR